MITINGVVYKSYEEQVLENQGDISNLDGRVEIIEGEIHDLKIETVKCVDVEGSFTTTGTVLMVVLHTDEATIPVFVTNEDVVIDGIVGTGETEGSATISQTAVTTSGCKATIYYQD